MTSPDRTTPDRSSHDDRVPASDVPASDPAPPDAAAPGDPAGTPPASPDDSIPDTIVEPAAGDDLSGTVAALASDGLDQAERRRLLGRLAGELRKRGIGDLFRPKAAMRWIADAVGDVAPRLPVRDRATLHRHFPGLSEDQLAERLIRNAALTTAGLGAASGGVAAIEWVATPTLLSAPVLLAAETVAVVAVEIKLIGELHEVYGQPVPGNGGQRAVALIQAWAQRRGINPMLPGVGVAAVLGTAARRDLRDRLLRRFGRNLTSYGPMLTGAAVASFLNRRATIALGQQIRKDLADRPRRAEISQWPER